ncbi:vanadium-dependent haloperoxidase [Hymenobacter sp. RP-2-7]|uniref:Vanadium-dependent haloperoxidase n=1 Tax=Hymenobacter polaris TaxID=2682546 RepID=A0A7Y0AET9_9BACT|nr:vanadium-dependent haloperoxidase [Hymenobacter polaris]NML66053.1 vanadium-dependent haloperoxidase [Hymenobacter polaris]
MNQRLSSLVLVVVALLSTFAGLARAPHRPSPPDPGKALDIINLTMVHDVISPPAAARYYAYTLMGPYCLAAAHNPHLPPLARLVQGFPASIGLDTVAADYDYQLAAYYCMLESARRLLPSGESLAEEEAAFEQEMTRQGVSASTLARSVRAARAAAAAVVRFSQGDHYGQLSALKRYTPLVGEGYWRPTPPAYFEPVEPNWKTIRPLVIDSASEFRPAACAPFSKDTASAFYRGARIVYNVRQHLTPAQNEIAQFWDCNPFAISTAGHMAIGFKKISPGGHWMNIAALVARQRKVGFDNTIAVLCLEGITLMDAFICCWDAKYLTNRIRPETYINRYMDVKWQPLLQTPPFPEYTSGHAVVSQASAELLTYLLGDKIAYVDNTEIPFGSGERKFTSFQQASQEAAISRLYGGIHYLESCTNGTAQGQRIGRFLVAKVRSTGYKP